MTLMHLHYFFDHQNNFGDALNAWIWDALLADRRMQADHAWLCGIGTILNHMLPGDRPMVIMSSGIGYGPIPQSRARQWDIAAVRGPLSAYCLGLDRNKAITDVAMLLSLLPDHAPATLSAAPRPGRSGTVFIPHYMAVDGAAWAQACAVAGIEFVDPRSDSRAIIARIQSAELVLAGAMHAAIVADVVRTPWIATAPDVRAASFKWNDWCLSMDIDHRPHHLPPSTLCEAVRHRLLPRSGDTLIAAHGVEALSRQYQRTNRAISHAAAAGYRRIATRAARTIAAQTGALNHRLAPGASQRRIADTAAVLRALTRAPATLSDDSVFHRQRERMAGALQDMANRYGLTLQDGLSL